MATTGRFPMTGVNVYVITDKATGKPVWFTHDEVLVTTCMKKTDQYLEHTEDSFREKFNGKTLTRFFLASDSNGEAYEVEDCLIQAPENTICSGH